MIKPYQSYKSSGISYLGDIPSHWVCKKLKWEITATSGTDSKTEFDNAPFHLFGANGIIGNSDTAEDFSDSGVVLVGRVGSAGAINFFKGKAGVSDNALVIRNLSYSIPRYDYYLLQSANLEDLINKNAQPLITGSDIRERYVAQPDDAFDRQGIANYLDTETNRIDSLILEKQNFMDLLKEKRQAILTRVLTESSSSQIRLKFYIKTISSGTSVNAYDVPAEPEQIGVLKTSCVYTGEFDHSKSKTVLEDEISKVSCPLVKDTLIVSRMNTPELVGAAGLVVQSVDNIFLPDRLWQVHFKSRVIPKFVHYWTLSDNYRAQVKLACAGTSASMQNLSQDEFGDFLIPQVDVKTQLSIIKDLDEMLGNIARIINEISQSIELLKEQRTALISAAVTGKIDVRNYNKTEAV